MNATPHRTNLLTIGFDVLGDQAQGDPTVCIAILDGPVDSTHPCFDGADLSDIEEVSPCALRPGRAGEHGTHVASLIFGQPGSLIEGLAPRCRGLLVPIFHDGEDGTLKRPSQADLARAIVAAVNAGAAIINISAGEPLTDESIDLRLIEALGLAERRGVLVVAAAGNDGCACEEVPAAIETVLVVGASAADASPAWMSNWGARYRDRGLLAPGVDIRGAAPGGSVSTRSGTSYAAPLVAGVAALLMSLQRRLGLEPDALEVRRALLASADRPSGGEPERYLTGTLNPLGAIAILSGAAMNNAHPDLQPQSPLPTVDAQSPTFTARSLSPSAHPEGARAGLSPSSAACGCKGGSASGSGGTELIYALGRIGFDYTNESHRDSFVQSGLRDPHDAAQLLRYLDGHPWAAEELTWTLCLDTLPLYAIKPAGPYAGQTYDKLRELLGAQIGSKLGLELVSLPGWTNSSTLLSSGQQVPQVTPLLRGVFGWKTAELVRRSLGAHPGDVSAFTASGASPVELSEAQAAYDARAAELSSFLDRVYYELRNAGRTPKERAINHAATNAFQVRDILSATYASRLQLAEISAEGNPLGRPGSECWDVTLKFFNPKDRLGQATLVHRFTVDVSGVIPVTIGEPRHWFAF